MSWNPLEWLKDKTNPPVQGPKLTKSQQALEEWRSAQRVQQQANQEGVRAQVAKDQAAGAKATKAYQAGKGGGSTPPKGAGPKGSAPKPSAAGSAKGLVKGAIGNAVRAANVWGLVRPGASIGERAEAGAYLAAPITTFLATNLTGSEDRTTKWKRLGYASPEAYNQSMRDYEARTGKSAHTGRPLSESPSVVPPKTEPVDQMTTNNDGSRVSSDGGTIYSADGKRYTTNGVTYDRDSGQAINPATNEISENGYSIDPQTNQRIDTPATTRIEEERINENGVVQKGVLLSSANAQLDRLGIEGIDLLGLVGGSRSKGAQNAEGEIGVHPKDYVASAKADGYDLSDGAYGNTATNAGVTGATDTAQTGTSEKPDRADRIRQVAFATDGVEADPKYQTGAARRAARAAFLDPRNKGYGAIRARDAAVGVHQLGAYTGEKNSDGEAILTAYKDGMGNEARFELASGNYNTEEGLKQWKDKYLKQAAEQKPTEEKPAATAEPPVTDSTPEITSDETPAPTTEQPIGTPGLPLTVATEDIPRGEAALKEYFKKLDAGLLTGPSPYGK